MTTTVTATPAQSSKLKMPVIGVNVNGGAGYEGGATLLAVLAWPDVLDDDKAMAERHAAICQLYLQAKADVDQDWAMTLQVIKPLYMSRPWPEVLAYERQLQHRLRVRMAAARMALPFIIEDERSGVTPKWPKGTLSLNKMAERVIDDTGESDTSNIKKRVWRPSRPVIHIAAAVAIAVDQGAAAERVISVIELLDDPAVIKWVVEVAAQFAEIITSTPRFRISSDQLVTLAPI